jgi:cysteine desulfurase
MKQTPIYLDYNATTPVDPEVMEIMHHYFMVEFGNAGSRTHIHGTKAKRAVTDARNNLANQFEVRPDQVIFTSGATESNNISILGLREYGEETGKKHIISTPIEHKAVLEPLAHLEKYGFEVEFLPMYPSGRIKPEDLQERLREDTLLVSIMHVNNETGVEQPILHCCEVLETHGAYFHVDAAQGFGKVYGVLEHPRIDLISISGHKIFGPKGVGALIVKKRRYKRPPLEPLMFGGGQERCLRPGTLPVPLIAGLGKAAEIAKRDHKERGKKSSEFKKELLNSLKHLNIEINGDHEYILPHVLNFSIPGLNSEAVILALKDYVSISNGSACNSAAYELSYVLGSMFTNVARCSGAIRISSYGDMQAFRMIKSRSINIKLKTLV